MTPETRRKATLWLLTVFLLGAATGALFGYSFAHSSYAATRPAKETDDVRRAKKVAEMTQELSLTPDQAQKIDGVIRQAQGEIRGIHDQSDAQIDVVRMKARDLTRGILTPEQKPRFEEYVKRLDAERQKQKELQNGH